MGGEEYGRDQTSVASVRGLKQGACSTTLTSASEKLQRFPSRQTSFEPVNPVGASSSSTTSLDASVSPPDNLPLPLPLRTESPPLSRTPPPAHSSLSLCLPLSLPTSATSPALGVHFYGSPPSLLNSPSRDFLLSGGSGAPFGLVNSPLSPPFISVPRPNHTVSSSLATTSYSSSITTMSRINPSPSEFPVKGGASDVKKKKDDRKIRRRASISVIPCYNEIPPTSHLTTPTPDGTHVTTPQTTPTSHVISVTSHSHPSSGSVGNQKKRYAAGCHQRSLSCSTEEYSSNLTDRFSKRDQSDSAAHPPTSLPLIPTFLPPIPTSLSLPPLSSHSQTTAGIKTRQLSPELLSYLMPSSSSPALSSSPLSSATRTLTSTCSHSTAFPSTYSAVTPQFIASVPSPSLMMPDYAEICTADGPCMLSAALTGAECDIYRQRNVVGFSSSGGALHQAHAVVQTAGTKNQKIRSVVVREKKARDHSVGNRKKGDKLKGKPNRATDKAGKCLPMAPNPSSSSSSLVKPRHSTTTKFQGPVPPPSSLPPPPSSLSLSPRGGGSGLGPGSVIPLGLESLIPKLPTDLQLASWVNRSVEPLVGGVAPPITSSRVISPTASKPRTISQIRTTTLGGISQIPTTTLSQIPTTTTYSSALSQIPTTNAIYSSAISHLYTSSSSAPSSTLGAPKIVSDNKTFSKSKNNQSVKKKKKQAIVSRPTALPAPLSMLPSTPHTPILHTSVPQTPIPQNSISHTTVKSESANSTPTPVTPPTPFVPGQPVFPGAIPGHLSILSGQLTPPYSAQQNQYNRNLAYWELERLYYHNLALLEQQRRYTKYLESELQSMEKTCRRAEPGNHLPGDQLQNYQQFLSYVAEPEFETSVSPFPSSSSDGGDTNRAREKSDACAAGAFRETSTGVELRPELDFYGKFLNQCNSSNSATNDIYSNLPPSVT